MQLLACSPVVNPHLYAAVHKPQRLGCVAQLVVVLRKVEQGPAEKEPVPGTSQASQLGACWACGHTSHVLHASTELARSDIRTASCCSPDQRLRRWLLLLLLLLAALGALQRRQRAALLQAGGQPLKQLP